MGLPLVRAKSILELMVTLAMGAAAVFMIVRMWDAPGANAGPRPITRALEDISSRGLSTSTRDAASAGNEVAPVVLIEYSDFECPYCARYARGTYEQIQREFVATGRVRYVFRNYPLERIHSSAFAAARAAVCAQQQHRFMEMRSYLFANSQALASIDMSQAGAAVGADRALFTSCLIEAGASVVESEKSEASRLGVTSTPTFFIGKRKADGTIRLITRIPGAMDYSYFKRGLDSALAQKPE